MRQNVFRQLWREMDNPRGRWRMAYEVQELSNLLLKCLRGGTFPFGAVCLCGSGRASSGLRRHSNILRRHEPLVVQRVRLWLLGIAGLIRGKVNQFVKI